MVLVVHHIAPRVDGKDCGDRRAAVEAESVPVEIRQRFSRGLHAGQKFPITVEAQAKTGQAVVVYDARLVGERIDLSRCQHVARQPGNCHASRHHHDAQEQ